MKTKHRKKATLAATLITFGSLAGGASAASIYSVQYTGVRGGALDGGTVLVSTSISDGDLWNTDILSNNGVPDHHGTVTATVSGSSSADGIYSYTGGGLAGFNVNTGGSGTLFSIANTPIDNKIQLSRGVDTLSFRYLFSLPSDAGIIIGQPVLDSQLFEVASGSGLLEFNGSESPFANVASLGAATVPEPSSALLIGLGALGFLARRKRTA
jgi:hypothetical protein